RGDGVPVRVRRKRRSPRMTPGGGADVAGAYDRWALTYDADQNATRDLAAVVLRRQPLALGGRAVVEIGCGTGANTAWLAERAARVIALDFSAAMLAQARERVPGSHVEFVSHDVCQPWPLADAS